MKAVKMKLVRITLRVFLLSVCAVLVLGCQEKTKSRNGLVDGEGTVTYQGQPVVDAVIELRPVDETIGNSVASGRTDEAGKFILTTVRPCDGAYPGKYKVTVAKQTEYVDGIPRDEYVAEKKRDGKGEVKFEKSKISTENLLPDKYADVETTPLEVEISTKGNKNIELVLED